MAGTRLTLGSPFVKTRIVRVDTNLNVTLAIAIAIIAIAVRFIDINQPFVDEWSWRQSDVASIARNYLRNGFRFAHPQIDWAGDQPGYVGTEFPVLPFIAAICYKFTGVHEWIGRVQSVIFFAGSLPFFFLLIRHVFGATAATWALFFYSFAPLNIMGGRCFMPDVPSLGLLISGLYFFLRWVESDEAKELFASAILISLSVLIKLPNVLIGAPLAYLMWQRFGGSMFRHRSVWIFAAITILPSAAWYWHGYQTAQKFYPHHWFGAGGIQLMAASWYWEIAKETLTSSLTPVLVLLAAGGLLVAKPVSRARLFYTWLAVMILFVVVAGYGNRHPWYRLPLVPIAAAFAGAACAWMAARFSRQRLVLTAGTIALTLLFGGLSYHYAKQFYHESAADLRLLGLELHRITPEKSLIVAGNYGDPTVFYYAERKGWHFSERGAIYNGHPASSAEAIADLATLRGRGATHFVVYTGTFWWLNYYQEFARHLMATSELVERTPQFGIYKLDSGAP